MEQNKTKQQKEQWSDEGVTGERERGTFKRGAPTGCGSREGLACTVGKHPSVRMKHSRCRRQKKKRKKKVNTQQGTLEEKGDLVPGHLLLSGEKTRNQALLLLDLHGVGAQRARSGRRGPGAVSLAGTGASTLGRGCGGGPAGGRAGRAEL